MPDRNHLQRLDNVWIKNPLYFLTVCAAQRRPILAQKNAAEVLTTAWRDAPRIHGWVVGRYVIMPDHVHFFARAQPGGKTLTAFIRDWKKWTARQAEKAVPGASPLWQPEFFDHVLRSAASYSEKWDYVRANPVRAGLATRSEEWPFSGECMSLEF